MRILGFSRKDWQNYETGRPKLEEDEFTTFRLTRRDKDWAVGEVAQVVYKPRSKEREILGIAKIISKEPRKLLTSHVRYCQHITAYEAEQDGFRSLTEMEAWLFKTHGSRVIEESINKLTLRWIR